MSPQWPSEARHLFIVGVIGDWNDMVYRCFLRDSLWRASTRYVFYEFHPDIDTSSANVQGRSHRKIWRLNSQRTNAVFHRTVNWSAEFRFGIIRISENQTHPIAVRSKTLKFTFVCGCTFVGCPREDVFQIKRMHVYRMYICVYRENN